MKPPNARKIKDRNSPSINRFNTIIVRHPHPSAGFVGIRIEVLLGASASWSAAALCRFGNTRCPRKAAEGRRTPKPVGRIQAPFEIMAPGVRGGAGGRGSSGRGRRRWCRQTERPALAIQRGRRKRPRWLCHGGGNRKLLFREIPSKNHAAKGNLLLERAVNHFHRTRRRWQSFHLD